VLTKEVLDEIIIRRFNEDLTLSIEKVDGEKYSRHYIKAKAVDYYGGWAKALQANSVPPNERVNVTKEDVENELRRLQNEGHSMKTGDFESWLYRGITKHFGGWKNTCKELGITQNKQGYVLSEKRKKAFEDKVIWTDDKIKSGLTEILSQGLSRNEMRNNSPKMFAAIDRRFSSFEDCGNYFGLEIPDKLKNYKHTKNEVDDFIRSSHVAGKNSSFVRSKGTRDEKSLYDSVVRIYGTWTGALKANGIEPKRIRREFNSKEDVAKAYKDDIINGVHRGHIRYFKNHFESLEELERYIGIFKEPITFAVYEKHILDRLVFEVYNSEPEKVTVEMLDNYDPNIVYSIRHHYKSILSYFSQLDVDFYAKPYVPFRWDAENTKRQLMRWIREGKPVNYTAIAHRHKGLIVAARKYYGNYEGLFSACGLDYDVYRTDTTLASFYGRALEDVFENILSDLEIKYVRQPEISDCHPDFVSGRTWYDAKLSEWTINFADCTTVKKYEPHCDSLIIVFLRGNKDTDKRLTEKTRLVNIYKYVDMLPSEKRSKYINALEEIESNVNSNELGSQTNDLTA
jgi:hypothetical protein